MRKAFVAMRPTTDVKTIYSVYLVIIFLTIDSFHNKSKRNPKRRSYDE